MLRHAVLALMGLRVAGRAVETVVPYGEGDTYGASSCVDGKFFEVDFGKGSTGLKLGKQGTTEIVVKSVSAPAKKLKIKVGDGLISCEGKGVRQERFFRFKQLTTPKRLGFCRRKKKGQNHVPAPVKKHDVTVCVVARWEEDAIQEWLLYQKWIGVDHVYVYDNNDSPDSMASLMDPYSSFVTHLFVPPQTLNFQLDIYNHCIRRFSANTRWIGFIDVDEFLVIKPLPLAKPTASPLSNRKARCIKRYLDSPAFASFDGVVINWLLFGTSGHKTRPGAAAGAVAASGSNEKALEYTLDYTPLRALELAGATTANALLTKDVSIGGTPGARSGFTVLERYTHRERGCNQHVKPFARAAKLAVDGGTGGMTGVHSMNRHLRLATADGSSHAGGAFNANYNCTVEGSGEGGEMEAESGVGAGAGAGVEAGVGAGAGAGAGAVESRQLNELRVGAVLHHYRMKSEADGQRRILRDIQNFKTAGDLANKPDDYAFSNEALAAPYDPLLFEKYNEHEDDTGVEIARAIKEWQARGQPDECAVDGAGDSTRGGNSARAPKAELR
jgi:hypothetical protein